MAVAAHAHAAPAYKGMSYTSFGANVLSTPASDQSLLNMSMVGTDTVALNFWWFQSSTSANTMAEDDSRYSSTLSSISHAIDTIHNLGMKVLLKPMLDVNDGTWRAYIDPSDKDLWFSHYTDFIGGFADLAKTKGVELLSIGCEMNTLEQAANDTRWKNLISNIRSRYTGKLTYAANFNPIGANIGGYQNVGWWDKLDYVGIDAYFPIASSNNTTLAGLTTAWQNQANSIEAWRSNAGLTDKQVLFTEVGYQSADGAATTPWGVGDNPPPTVDLQEQADAYHALMTVMPTKSWWDGAFWWSWETNPNAGGTSDSGFTPQNKPAQTILQQYYGGTGPAPPPHAAPTQRLYSFENDLETWHSPNFSGSKPVSLAQSTTGATAGTHSIAVTQTGSGFNWDTAVTLTGDALTALSLALADNKANYQLVYDVTYNTASIPQSAGLSFINQSIAIQNAAGTWSQVDSVGNASGRSNQTIHVAIPLSNFTTLTAGSNSYNLYIALNGNWGTAAATVFFDNIKLINLLVPLTGDFDHNGKVDAADYILWRQTLGSTTDSRADANFNGIVDAADYQLWRSNFGSTSTSGGASLDLAQVPEPTAVLLICAAAFVIASFPRRRETSSDWCHAHAAAAA